MLQNCFPMLVACTELYNFNKKRPRFIRACNKAIYNYTAVGLRIMPNIIAITAITNNTCIRLPAAIKNTPIAQPIIRITAIMYNNEFMISVFNLFFC